jgi:hypothetical protein
MAHVLQVHVLEDRTVHVYSRNLENTTSKYPDIVARMPQALAPGVKSVVLDGEVQAWDTEKKVFLPFQVLTTRKRKDVAEDQIKVQVLLPINFVRTAPFLACIMKKALPLYWECCVVIRFLIVRQPDGANLCEEPQDILCEASCAMLQQQRMQYLQRGCQLFLPCRSCCTVLTACT